MKVLHKFPGGLKLKSYKELSHELDCLPPFIPEFLIFPLAQQIGTPSELVVEIGEQVLKGQLIAKQGSYVSSAIHASSSGVVEDIGLYSVSSGEQQTCIVIRTDGNDRWADKMTPLDFKQATTEELKQRIADAGIIGMGGAGFPAQVKINEGDKEHVETLIINGVECEPYITCDDRLIRERPEEVINGAKILTQIVGAEECYLAVEADMPDAYKALIEAAYPSQKIIKVPAVYPAGGEKQLIRTITGLWIEPHGLPIQASVLVQNVSTVAAIYRAVVKGEPVISRIVTVAGDAVDSRNIEVLNGTPVGDLITIFQERSLAEQEVVFGGPMMGMIVSSNQVPVLKKTSCVLVRRKQAVQKESSCIRCGACVDVCPVSLQPQMLYAMTKNNNFTELQQNRLFDCIECACCDEVCPSHIPLVNYYKHAKRTINERYSARRKADKSKQQYLLRITRLEEAKILKSKKVAPKVQASNTDLQSEIAAAIKRSKAKRRKPKRSLGKL